MEKFDKLRTIIDDAEKYQTSGDDDISRSLLKSASEYAEKMSKKPIEITGFKK